MDNHCKPSIACKVGFISFDTYLIVKFSTTLPEVTLIWRTTFPSSSLPVYERFVNAMATNSDNTTYIIRIGNILISSAIWKKNMEDWVFQTIYKLHGAWNFTHSKNSRLNVFWRNNTRNLITCTVHCVRDALERRTLIWNGCLEEMHCP